MTRNASDILFHNGILLTVKVIIAIGLGCIAVHALSLWDGQKATVALSVGVTIALAALLCGGLLGFLFGIPRTLQNDRAPEQPPGGEDAGQVGSTNGTSYHANTNLEQISDWLTKILVGVGLTQIHAIAGRVEAVSQVAATAIGAGAGAQVFVVALIIYFAVCGFLLGYLWTRLYLTAAFRLFDDASLSALSSEVQDLKDQFTVVDSDLDAMKRQAEIDGEAINLLERQLRAGPDAPKPTQSELEEIICKASPNTRVYVFYQAQQLRTETWRSDKLTMERSIPIFRALIASDVAQRFHRNYAQLGYALKDKLDPSPEDLVEAEEALGRAIRIRGDWRERGFVLYEFNRALCRIMLDSAFRGGRRSQAGVRRAIEADLEAARNSNWLRTTVIPNDETIQRWLALNSEEEIRSKKAA